MVQQKILAKRINGRIGINILFLLPNKVGGTEYYARSILEQWSKDRGFEEVWIYCNKLTAQTLKDLPEKWKIVIVPYSSNSKLLRILYEQFFFPFQLLSHGVNEVYSLGYIGPIFFPRKKIITVHDANWKDCPEDFSFIERILLKFLIEPGLWTADEIITDSDYSKSRLVFHFPFLKNKLKIISPQLGKDLQLLLNKKKLSHPFFHQSFILCVSNFYPHKKVDYLVSLFISIKSTLPNLHLVIIGKNGKDADLIFSLVKEHSNIHVFSQVSLAKLAAFYQHAVLFILPSLYEGFGYPVYEALEVQKKVIVGKKKLYDKKNHNRLYELSFNIQKDQALIISLLEKKLNLDKVYTDQI